MQNNANNAKLQFLLFLKKTGAEHHQCSAPLMWFIKLVL